MNVLVFEIKTIPDIEGGQRIYGLEGLDDKSTAKAMYHIHQQKTGSSVLPLHLHKIAAISIVYRGMGDDMGNMVAVRSLGDLDASEAELLRLFFAEMKERTPTLVSWDGSAFALPVIHYRSLKNSVAAPNYWENGTHDEAFRHDNYLSRQHERHTDLKDVLASYNHEATAPLNEIAKLLGFPGKMGMDDDNQVWQAYLSGNLKGIRDYCEVDVLNTYLIYLRYQLIRGEIDDEKLEQEYALLRNTLDNSEQAHLQSFSKAW